jgi:hypothetical protein
MDSSSRQFLCVRLLMSATCTEELRKMPKSKQEMSEMSSVEFVQYALRERVAPPSLGSIKARIRYASRTLGWTANRTKDAWYADPRISISADELREIEKRTGLRYAQEELRTNDDLIAKAEALMVGHEADFYSAFIAALRSLARPHNRA